MIETKYHVSDGNVIVERIQDIEPIIEANKADLCASTSGWGGDLHHVARIPNIVIEKWCKERGFKFEDFIRDKSLTKKLLNDPENSMFRTKAGRI